MRTNVSSTKLDKATKETRAKELPKHLNLN